MPKPQAFVSLDASGHQLHPSLRPINSDVSKNQDILAVLKLKANIMALILEEDAGELRVHILKGEVPVTRPMVDEVGDLASGPEVMQARIILQAVPNPLVQFCDCEYLSQSIIQWDGSIFNISLRSA
jgi:hypothetical protein